jgi:hypothetical protein
MDNYITLYIATLERLGMFTEEEAKKLAKELIMSGLPSDYTAMGLVLDEKFKASGIKTYKELMNPPKPKVDNKK